MATTRRWLLCCRYRRKSTNVLWTFSEGMGVCWIFGPTALRTKLTRRVSWDGQREGRFLALASWKYLPRFRDLTHPLETLLSQRSLGGSRASRHGSEPVGY